jgi:hypothetical protein
MLEICYSLSEAIEILGTRKDIEGFRQEVLTFLKTDLERIHIGVETEVSFEPWDFVASDLQIIQNDSPVKVSIAEERVIKIEGSKENLKKFTSFLEFDENAVSGHHSHFEYYDYEGNIYVHPDSFPLIIEIK